MPDEKLVEQKKKVEVLPTKQVKKEALAAIVVDTLADELPAHVQEKLPSEGVMVKQAPKGKLTVKTDIVSELPPAGIVATSKASKEYVAKQKKDYCRGYMTYKYC